MAAVTRHILWFTNQSARALSSMGGLKVEQKYRKQSSSPSYLSLKPIRRNSSPVCSRQAMYFANGCIWKWRIYWYTHYFMVIFVAGKLMIHQWMEWGTHGYTIFRQTAYLLHMCPTNGACFFEDWPSKAINNDWAFTVQGWRPMFCEVGEHNSNNCWVRDTYGYKPTHIQNWGWATC